MAEEPSKVNSDSQPTELTDLSQLLVDQEADWQKGKPQTLEEISSRLRVESRSPDNLLALICNEVCLRIRAGEKPTLEEYQKRFPEFSNDLAIQWEIDQWIVEGFSSSLLAGVDGSLLTEQQSSELLASTATVPFDMQNLESQTDASAKNALNRDTKAPDALMHHSRYRLIRQIGRGGMGTVWLAMHIVMNRPVALKVIRPDLLSKPNAVARFRREVQAAARLHHPNVVTAYDAEHVGNTHFLVVEYVEGQTLANQVSKGALSLSEACEAIQHAACGLAHAHQSGLVHRDVKPGNLIRDSSGTVKVLDFGLVVDPTDDSSITGENMVMGTPDYVAPEQALTPSQADVRSDIYSLGCTFYHLLAGKAPFSGLTLLGKLDAHRYATPEPIENIPKELHEILFKMMAKRPEDRYQSADEVILVIERFVGGKAFAQHVERNASNTTANSTTRRRAVLATSAVLAIGLFEGVRRTWFPYVSPTAQFNFDEVFGGEGPVNVVPPPMPNRADETPEGWACTIPDKPTSIGDGVETDLSIENGLMKLHAIDNWQLWINYGNIRSGQMIVRADVRIAEAKDYPVFKFIVMAPGVAEYSLQIMPQELHVELTRIESESSKRALQGSSLLKNFRKEWTTIEFQLDKESISGTFDNRVQLKGVAVANQMYFLSMAAQNCVAHVHNLRVFMPKRSAKS